MQAIPKKDRATARPVPGPLLGGRTGEDPKVAEQNKVTNSNKRKAGEFRGGESAGAQHSKGIKRTAEEAITGEFPPKMSPSCSQTLTVFRNHGERGRMAAGRDAPNSLPFRDRKEGGRARGVLVVEA